MRRFIVVAGACLMLAAGSSFAYTIDDVLVESWAGSGANEALFVVDFWPDNGQEDSFAFGYSFDTPTITGLDLLDGLHGADNDFTYAQSGGFITDMWYVTDGATYHTGYSWPDSWWSYWLSDDIGETWGFSSTGAGDRILSDGDTDGWLGKPGSDWVSTPVTPMVPEPGSLGLLLVGTAALVSRCRR